MMTYEDVQIKEALEAPDLKVQSEGDAADFFRKIAFLKKKKREVEAIANAELNRVADWMTSETDKLNSKIAYFEQQIQTFYQLERERNPKYRLTSPYGSVSARKTKEVTYDEDTLLKWLHEHDRADLIKIKEAVDKMALKVEYKDGIDQQTGEIVEGMDVREVERISIKTEVE